MDIHLAGSRPTRLAPKEYFTGTVLQDPIVATPAPAKLVSTRVSFEPGARTAWHTHPLGQTLYVISGIGRVQAKGGPVREIRPGDVVWIPPGEKHWRCSEQRNDPYRDAGVARRQLCDLDGARHRHRVQRRPGLAAGSLHAAQRSKDQLRCAVHVPEHIAARQVPEPEEPLRRPEPTARLMPLLSVTLIVPASATRPDAVTTAPAEAT